MAKARDLDILLQFLPASWRGVPFPVADFDISWSHDHAVHKVYKQPVSNIETTGRNSREFGFDIPFRNGVIPGPTEDDLRGRILYPDVYLAFVDAFNEDTAGDLIHPSVGKVNCKPGQIRVIGSAQSRDGVMVHATFTESDDTPEGNAPPPDSPAPMTGIASEAENLDTMLLVLKPPPLDDDTGEPFTSFAQFGALLRAPFDTLSLLSTRVGNAIAAFGDQLDRLQESVSRLNDVSMWPILDSIGKLRDSLIDLTVAGQKEALKLHKYVTPHDMTVSDISNFLQVDFESLILANPFLCDSPIVVENTTVIYQR
ncbi:MAG: DNA circularization N-terminal domain-containing protein [Patescibacteria group bacterium]